MFIDVSTTDIATAVADVINELIRARNRFPAFQSAHEGHAIIREEFDELWDAIKAEKWDRDPDLTDVRTEAIQLAAMALRFVMDIVPAHLFEVHQ